MKSAMHSKQLIVPIILLVLFGIANVVDTFEAKPECWTASECFITSTKIPVKSPSHMHIKATYNCTLPRDDEPTLSKNCHSHTNVTLDGCNVDRTDTIGTEYIEEPDCVQSLIIENFPAPRIRFGFKNFTRLTELVIRNNAINGLTGKNFKGLESLKYLELRSNNLETIANETFEDLHMLSSLTIIEPTLKMLRNLSFGHVLNYMHIDVKSVEWPHLPDSLIEFKMVHTIMLVSLHHDFIVFENMYQLRSVSMCFCDLIFFPKITSNTIETLNFTDNVIHLFVAHKLINLITFDISRNKLQRLSPRMLGEMKKLKTFLAADNVIEFVSERAFLNNTLLERIDLSNNRLSKLDIQFPVVSINGPPRQAIIVNGNPWSMSIISMQLPIFANVFLILIGCDWLSRAAAFQHQLFDCFEFKINKTGDNVRGLQCTYEDESPNITQLSTTSETPPSSEASPATTSAATITTITLLSVALACTSILSIVLYVKYRQHSQPFRPQRVNERGSFVQNFVLRHLRQNAPQADETANAEEENHPEENR